MLTKSADLSEGPRSATYSVCHTAIFSEHMVLQQQHKIRIWGWADAGEAVTVTLGGNQETSKANEAGRWQVELPPMQRTQGDSRLDIYCERWCLFRKAIAGVCEEDQIGTSVLVSCG